jgi:NAD(P)-dependent dehydrogenase (short-subunit alcohol dehydrogenase family)
MNRICEGRVVVVTGAGRGIGRAHALAFAAEGALVVVNDVGVTAEGAGAEHVVAQQVVREIQATGGRAVANTDDVATSTGAESLIRTAVDAFGRIDVLVNNAGFLRDRTLARMSENEWDAVIRVHLKGHFLPMRHAVEFWRDESKGGGDPQGRVINTTSGAGLMGSVGQGNYAAAKAGIVGLTLVAAAEWERYGVTVNAIAPAARTRMTAMTFADKMAAPEHGFDAMAPENVSPLVVWLGSRESAHVTGRVFEVEGDLVSVADGWRHGPARCSGGRRWQPAELGPVVDGLLAESPPPTPVYGATAPEPSSA